MASSFTDRAPPPFDSKVDVYTKWKNKFTLWQSITDVAKAKQGGLLVLRLDDATQEAVLELVTHEEIKEEDGAKKVLDKLDVIFDIDTSLTAYQAYEEFESYRRPVNLSIAEYCSEFQRKLAKVKNSGTTLAEHIIAYRLLKSANLSETEEQLVKATTATMTNDDMTKQLKKVFNSTLASGMSKSEGEVKIKEEPIENETLYGGTYRSYRTGPPRSDRRDNRDYNEQRDGYQFNNRRSERGGNRGYSDQRSNIRWSTGSDNRDTKDQKKQRGRNPLDIYGKVTRCDICDSINHWRIACPDRED